MVHVLAAFVYSSSAFRSRLSLPVRRFCCAFPEGGAARLAIAAGAAAVLGARYRTCDAQTQRINGIWQKGSAHDPGELRALPTELVAAPVASLGLLVSYMPLARAGRDQWRLRTLVASSGAESFSTHYSRICETPRLEKYAQKEERYS